MSKKPNVLLFLTLHFIKKEIKRLINETLIHEAQTEEKNNMAALVLLRTRAIILMFNQSVDYFID